MRSLYRLSFAEVLKLSVSAFDRQQLPRDKRGSLGHNDLSLPLLRKDKFGDAFRLLLCRLSVGTAAIVLGVLGLVHSPAAFAVGCDIRVSEDSPTSIVVVGVCATSTDSQQACISFAQDHGYGPEYCHSGGSTIGGVNWSFWGAGNLCESNPGPGGNCGPWGTKYYLGGFYWLQYYAHVQPLPQAHCGPTCNGVADPINPAGGAVYTTEVDLSGKGSVLAFKRFYNSMDTGGPNLGPGWRHSFSATVRRRDSSIIYRKYRNESNYTSLYSSPSSACTNGFNWIKRRVPNWQNAVAIYANGKCTLSLAGVHIATLPLYAPQLELSYAPPVVNAISGTTLLGFDVIRDDGQLITFWLEGGTLVAPPGISLRLQQTAGGFTVTDSHDTVETYDPNGKLLSVTSRAGVVQTMGYDSLGRLSTATDSFGHSLMLSYDAQNRLSTVTRQ